MKKHAKHPSPYPRALPGPGPDPDPQPLGGGGHPPVRGDHQLIPGLSFSGTTATCTLSVTAKKGTDITGTLTLYRGSTKVKSWDVDETTSVSFRDTCTVTKGYSYKLVADLTVTGAAGTDDVYEYVSKTCS